MALGRAELPWPSKRRKQPTATLAGPLVVPVQRAAELLGMRTVALVTRAATSSAPRPLLSVDEVAILLGASRSSVYRSIERGDLPLPVFRINGRLRIARRAVERLLAGERPFAVDEDNPEAITGSRDQKAAEDAFDAGRHEG